MGQSSHFQGQGAARSQQGAAGTQRGQGAGAAAAGAEGGAEGQRARGQGAPPPPDERTWLQKNWLFVLGETCVPAAMRCHVDVLTRSDG